MQGAPPRLLPTLLPTLLALAVVPRPRLGPHLALGLQVLLLRQ